MHKPVDMVLRSDALEKNGGDNFQADQYQSVLEALGYDVRSMPYHAGMSFRDDAVVHIFNVDRPYDFLSAVRTAGSRRIIVSSIHHDLSSVRMMRNAERNQGIRSFIGRVLPESGRELLAYFVRNFRAVRDIRDGFLWLVCAWNAIPDSWAVWQRVGASLDQVHAVAVLAEGERRSLMRDTCWRGLNSVLIPNGAPASDYPELPVWTLRENDICVVGRIEPRKRQLELARAATEFGLRITFVGPASPSSPRYAQDFEAAVASNPNLTWLGGLERRRVLNVMANSRVLLNASWVEVQSLVDIEAASMGCWVVVGRGGNSEEWLPRNVVSVDSHEISEVLSVVNEILTGEEGPGVAAYSQTWEMAAVKLAEVYSN